MVRVITATGRGSYTEIIQNQANMVGEQTGHKFTTEEISGYVRRLREGSTNTDNSRDILLNLIEEMGSIARGRRA